MLRKRIVPCLDVRGGRLVKGVNFESLRDCGDPVDAAQRYAADGADEIVWLNIAAGEESWSELLRAVERAAETVDVPLCVGGGVSASEHARELLLAGADKISINTAPLDRPELISELADQFGTQCVVVAIDARRRDAADPARGWEVYTHGGRTATGLDALEWAVRMERAGAGEILLTSMDRDGTRAGYDLELTRAVVDAVDVPVVASGGVGGLEHLYDGLTRGGASAVLAASIFHYGEHTVRDAKAYLAARGVPVRP